jgi:Dyp-type peroxidase family
MADLPLSDIQGFVLRTYAMPALRVFVLRVANAPLAGALLAATATDDPAMPSVTTATPWEKKPAFCVNIALTSAGLAALGLPQASLETFPPEFREGAVSRAPHVGDVGDSAPAVWKGELASADVHALVFVFAESEEIIERTSAELRGRFAAGPAFVELSAHAGRALPGNVSHFGYRDGFAQPTIDGGLPPTIADPLPKAPAGEFILGYPSQYRDFTYPVPEPASELGRNGSFVAFRILAQDCDAFEEFLQSASTKSGLDPELIAAKLCGRWRNGVPLALSPDTPQVAFGEAEYNRFDYVPTDAVPEAYNDRRGYRCPIGAHVRRMNPRHSAVAGNSGLKRRIMRRGLPYGPPHDPANPRDGIERGLLGIFIGVSLKDQFEFLMSDWANKGTFAPGLGSTRDPIIGDNSAEGSQFAIPVEGGPSIKLAGLSRFVTCRGGAYCFLPSVTALKYLASIAMREASVRVLEV